MGTTTALSSLLNVTRASTGLGQLASGALTEYSADTPRYSWISGTRYLLVEGSQVESIRNNTMVPNNTETGSGTSTPTNWNITTGLGAVLTAGTATVVGVGKELGVDYIDIRYQGTGTGSAAIVLQFDVINNPQATALPGTDTYYGSIYSKIVSITSGSITSHILRTRCTNGSVGLDPPSSVNMATTVGALTRYSVLMNTNVVGTTNCQLTGVLSFTAASTVDITIRYGLPSLQKNANYQRLPFRTDNVTFTQAADAIYYDLPSWLANRTDYSIYAEGIPFSTTGFATDQTIASINNATATERIRLSRTASTGALSTNISGASMSGTYAGVPAGTWAQNASARLVAAHNSGAQMGAYNGTAATDGTATGSPTITRLTIGAAGDGTLTWYGAIERIILWGSRRTDTAMQGLNV